MHGGEQPAVLIADDDLALRGYLAMVLEQAGYRVTTAADGREALSRLAHGVYALLLLDLSMPVLDGWQVQERLREADNHIPVVVMSSDRSVRALAAAECADAYLQKPFSGEQVLELVQRLAA